VSDVLPSPVLLMALELFSVIEPVPVNVEAALMTRPVVPVYKDSLTDVKRVPELS